METEHTHTEIGTNTQQKPTKKGSMLWKIKLVIFLAVVLAAVFFLASTIGINKLRQMRAETQVTVFVKALYPDQSVVGKVCQGEDTDSDSYVSCAVTLTSRENPLSVQCPTIVKSYLGTTCRLTPGTSPVNI
jgi:flagellar basal body-associated protein FliL